MSRPSFQHYRICQNETSARDNTGLDRNQQNNNFFRNLAQNNNSHNASQAGGIQDINGRAQWGSNFPNFIQVLPCNNWANPFLGWMPNQFMNNPFNPYIFVNPQNSSVTFFPLYQTEQNNRIPAQNPPQIGHQNLNPALPVPAMLQSTPAMPPMMQPSPGHQNFFPAQPIPPMPAMFQQMPSMIPSTFPMMPLIFFQNFQYILNSQRQIHENELKRLKDMIKKANQSFLEYMNCPISLQLMTNPVILTTCGHTFDRTSIQDWLEYRDNCPICKNQSEYNGLVPNFHLKQLITAYLQIKVENF